MYDISIETCILFVKYVNSKFVYVIKIYKNYLNLKSAFAF